MCHKYGTDFSNSNTQYSSIRRTDHPHNTRPNLTQLQLPDLTPFQITSDSQESTRRSVTLRSYQLGEHYIPTLNIYNTSYPAIPITVVRQSLSNNINPILNEIINSQNHGYNGEYTTLLIICSLCLIYWLLLKHKKKENNLHKSTPKTHR